MFMEYCISIFFLQKLWLFLDNEFISDPIIYKTESSLLVTF